MPNDPIEAAMAEAQAELEEAQRRMSAAWAEMTHAQNALQRAQQKWLDARTHAKKSHGSPEQDPKQA